jgi:O-antigen ligase
LWLFGNCRHNKLEKDDFPLKWVFFAVCVVSVFPFAGWLRRNPDQARIVWVIFGFLPFGLAAVPDLDIALINWAGWAGYVQGALFSALDALALAIFFALPKSETPLPFLRPMLFYFGAMLLSVFQAFVPMAALFYPWQLLRVFLVYLVVARASTEQAVIRPLLTGLVLGLCLQAGMTVYERYGLGILQTGGSFGSQNLLGLVSNLVALPLFALLLSGRTGWISIAGPLAGCVIAVLTTSRATLGLAGAGLGLIFLISARRGMTARKAAIGLAGAIVLGALSPIAISSFETRFTEAPASQTYDERAAFIRAAEAILDDHPFGVGANNYVVMANIKGYLQRAGVIPTVTSRSAPVHNVYWLTAAETGYLGLAALLFLFFPPLKAALACGWRNRDDDRGDLLLGLGVSLLILYIHCYFEWIFFLAPVQFIFAITLGMIAGLTQQLGYWSAADTPFEEERRHASVEGRGRSVSDGVSRRFL